MQTLPNEFSNGKSSLQNDDENVNRSIVNEQNNVSSRSIVDNNNSSQTTLGYEAVQTLIRSLPETVETKETSAIKIASPSKNNLSTGTNTCCIAAKAEAVLADHKMENDKTKTDLSSTSLSPILGSQQIAPLTAELHEVPDDVDIMRDEYLLFQKSLDKHLIKSLRKAMTGKSNEAVKAADTALQIMDHYTATLAQTVHIARKEAITRLETRLRENPNGIDSQTEQRLETLLKNCDTRITAIEKSLKPLTEHPNGNVLHRLLTSTDQGHKVLKTDMLSLSINALKDKIDVLERRAQFGAEDSLLREAITGDTLPVMERKTRRLTETPPVDIVQHVNAMGERLKSELRREQLQTTEQCITETREKIETSLDTLMNDYVAVRRGVKAMKDRTIPELWDVVDILVDESHRSRSRLRDTYWNSRKYRKRRDDDSSTSTRSRNTEGYTSTETSERVTKGRRRSPQHSTSSESTSRKRRERRKKLRERSLSPIGQYDGPNDTKPRHNTSRGGAQYKSPDASANGAKPKRPNDEDVIRKRLEKEPDTESFLIPDANKTITRRHGRRSRSRSRHSTRKRSPPKRKESRDRKQKSKTKQKTKKKHKHSDSDSDDDSSDSSSSSSDDSRDASRHGRRRRRKKKSLDEKHPTTSGAKGDAVFDKSKPCPPELRAHGKYLNIPTYDPRKNTWGGFRGLVEEVLWLKGIDRRHWVNFTYSSVRGDAVETLTSVPREALKKWEDMCELMEKEYDMTQAQLEQELNDRVIGPKESFREFAQDVTAMVRRCNGNKGTKKEAEERALTFFKQQMRVHPSCAAAFKNGYTPTLADAILLAERTVKPGDPGAKPDYRRRIHNRNRRDSYGDNQTYTDHYNAHGECATETEEEHYDQMDGRYVRRDRGDEPKYADKTCKYCGQKGHLKRACPKLRKDYKNKKYTKTYGKDGRKHHYRKMEESDDQSSENDDARDEKDADAPS